MFEVRNIAFSFGRRQVLRDVSFVASPGETVAVVGANGAGKTTLLRILATLAVPDAGMALLDGQDVLNRPGRYRHQLGYMPEAVAADDDMTVRDYLEYRAVLRGEFQKRLRRRLGEAMETCRISDVQKARIRSLSLGLRKRVALADALMLHPRVLLLDDALAGLDCTMRATMGQILSDAAAFSSVVLAGHEIDDMAKWATRFLVLRDGVVSSVVDATGTAPLTLAANVRTLLAGGGRS